MATNFKQGLYTVKHPQKYIGDVTKVRYMSSWELNAFNFLDGNQNVLQWSSENIAIPYIKPTDGRVHKYYPDLLVLYKDRHGQEHWELIEIKPSTQLVVSRSKSPKTRMFQNLTLAVNKAKWDSAELWCEHQRKNGMDVKFKLLTEKQVFS
jgi:hypothetical protein